MEVKFPEYRAKQVFRKYGIPIPEGVVVLAVEDVVDPPLPAVVKAQVLAGGRMKAGGIRFAESLEEVREAVEAILDLEIGGYPVQGVLLEERLPVQQELYLSLTIDRSARAPLLMASTEGGIDIEGVPEEKIFRVHIPPLLGMQRYVLRRLQRALGFEGKQGQALADVASALFRLFEREDAELVEINPLVLTSEGSLVAGDAKLVLEDNALFRHPEYADVEQDFTTLEKEARERGIAFVQLDGDIGVIANGAGLTMATMDVLHLHGGQPGVFLDLGGTDDAETVKEAFLLMLKARPSVIFLNIFGGITKSDTVAEGVRDAMEEAKTDIPVVARIRGINEERARELLREAGMKAHLDLDRAAEAVVGGG
ncbi:MAG: ADP-forming succinate--CoA ligase subunit beta [Thermoplasmata archaeon]|nr:ADP-forming succinate--CoA ligase subunit beta [Thermoplasmata archaeon]